MYKLLALDLDGTLIDSNLKIPENNKTAIGKAIEKGVRVCLCSGRSFLSLRHYEKELGIDGKGNYGICFNGSIVYQNWDHKALRETRLSNELAMFIIDELAQFEGDTVVYAAEKLMAVKETEQVRYYKERSRIPLTILDSFHTITEDVSKVVLRGEHESLRKASIHMAPLVDGKCNQFFTERTLLEYTNLEANKGAALTFLAEYLNIKKEEVIAVGDQLNDIPMLKAAGFAVAVQNAQDEIKKVAAYVTKADHNQGAIEEVVERFI